MKLNEAIEIIKSFTFVENGEDLLDQTEQERQQTLALFCIFNAIKKGELVPKEPLERENKSLKNRCAVWTNGLLCKYCPLECEKRSMLFTENNMPEEETDE